MKKSGNSKQFGANAQQTIRMAAAVLVACLGLYLVGNLEGRKGHAQTEAQTGAQAETTIREQQGKQIYIQGTSASGKGILAYLGESSLEVPASAMPCANCHGLNGAGKPEGGIFPSNVTWEALTKPYGLTHADGRRHPPYTERALELAITRGTDPAGNKLQNLMPRYQMSSEDMLGLIAYLKRLGKETDPGIYESKIVIGTAIPAKGSLGEMGQAIKAVTTAYFDELNSQGGIYNRRIELTFVETGETPAATRANFERSFTDRPVFAMTGAFIAGAEKEVVSLLAAKEVPLIGPMTLYPQTTLPLNRQVFYLLSGTEDQVRALVDFAAKKSELKNQGIAVVYPRSQINAVVVDAIKDQTKKQGWTTPQSYDYVAGQFDAAVLAPKLIAAKPAAVFFLGSVDEAISLMRAAEKANWFPSVFLTSANAGAGILQAPVAFDGKVFLSFPTSPEDLTPEGIGEFRALAEKYKLPTNHVAAQISAYTAAKILTEGLKKMGKDLSREKLIQVLEGLYEYRTGLTPAISFGPNRRVGASGAYVVTVDLKTKQLSPASGWIGIN
ncbi:MAG TPA: ABC transporter substrate-binding protein [Pyrinomonadaceae bacterium]|jgi:ABC-type branched-subunit amino acid transport system substrate-binding protein|nr:ABC transporter substrate-binding protein [Pyrinomonadaceae bacterium]